MSFYISTRNPLQLYKLSNRTSYLEILAYIPDHPNLSNFSNYNIP